MYVISMKQDKKWYYLVKNFDGAVYFVRSEESAKKFNTLREAQGFFKNNKKNILREINVSKYNLSTLAIRQIVYSESCKLKFTEKDFEFANKKGIEVGDVVTHDDFYRGVVTNIEDDIAFVEFSFGPNSGGTLSYKIDELKKFNTI